MAVRLSLRYGQCVDIRTKLIFALVSASLLSMLAMGAFVSQRVEDDLRESTLSRLDELAESRQQALRWIIEGWRDRANLVASRTQMRASLDELRRVGGSGAPERIETILMDAIGSSRRATRFTVYDLDGQSIASVTSGADATVPSREILPMRPPEGEPAYAGLRFSGSRAPQVAFAASMAFQGRPVGTLLAVFDARELLELTASHEGLGATGETLVFAEDAAGALRTLHPTRHDPGGPGGTVLASDEGSLAARAMARVTEPVWEGFTDYRGEEVWAATRLVPETGWGLVVKVDRAEEERPYGEFRGWLGGTAIILSAFVILIGFMLGLRFALPIQSLADVAERIRSGEMGARAAVAHEDEVGLLARTFNGMADEIEQQMSLLREFRKLFDVSIDLMCIAGTGGYFKRTNAAFSEVTGWTEEELCGRPFFEFVHPDDVAKTELEVAKLAGGLPTIHFQNRYLCKDGTYKILNWTSHPDDGVLYAIARVLEGRETALARQFQKLFDESTDLMCIAGTDGYFKRTNPAFNRVLGWTEKELCERRFFEFIHPEDVAKTEAEVAKLALGEATISFSNRYRCKDGTYKLLQWTSEPEAGVLYAIARVVGDPPAA